jgi:hypothetical protein
MTTTTIRRPLLDEMTSAASDALTETDPNRRAFHEGFFTGYAIAFGLLPRDQLDAARTTPFSTNLHLGFWNPSWFADVDSYRATGIRHGYWMGSSENPLAYQCDLCSERIVEGKDETESCEHGIFCEGGCINDFHAGAGFGRYDCRYTDDYRDAS